MNESSVLQKPIEYLKGVGAQRADLLKKELNIFVWGDLLLHFPYRYIDRSQFTPISEIQADDRYYQLKVVLLNIQEAQGGKKNRLTAIVKDGTGKIPLVWFQGAPWIKKKLVPGLEYVVFGKVGFYMNQLQMAHPELEPATPVYIEELRGFQPLYPSTEKLKNKQLDTKGISKLIKNLLPEIKPSDLREIFPPALLERYRIPDRYVAFMHIHAPSSEYEFQRAQVRFKFEELFAIQLRLLSLKKKKQDTIQGYVFRSVGTLFKRFYTECLPFQLTEAQKEVLRQIRQDMGSGQQMNRLLQGDVGSGKTIVALMAMLLATDNEYQSALMAPTEILAQQHYHTIRALVEKLPVHVALLTGHIRGQMRKDIFSDLNNGKINILIGTHALLEEDVVFKSLGLVIVDEQHRFGVAQRARLWKKSDLNPHILVMTATPIPRTLAMTTYGDLDYSAIRELPPGRKPITTYHFNQEKRLRMFGLMRDEIKKGRQVYVVYPLIQESETLDYHNLEKGYEDLSAFFKAPDYAISIVHGRMKSEEKEMEMQRFVRGETHIMMATTVIEVGVNVPNASMIVIESAERFGLSQLHQLRGRVGRGEHASYCILMTGFKLSHEAKQRIQAMVRSQDGFELAEIDLQLRGPGDIHGTQQSGELPLKLANLAKDGAILKEARHCVQDILEKDPTLSYPEHEGLKLMLVEKQGQAINWSLIS